MIMLTDVMAMIMMFILIIIPMMIKMVYCNVYHSHNPSDDDGV